MVKNTQLIKVIAVSMFIVMVAVNALANILPINGITTGAVSDSYPNLFAPAPITFSIWGLIYLLMGLYSVFQLVSNTLDVQLTRRVNILFIASSVINSIWIFAWHYRLIWLTVLLMAGLLIVLIKIADTLNSQTLSVKEKLLIKLPFGVYFGWITVATIANITALLVDLNWSGFGIGDERWMIVVLLVGVAIAAVRMFKDKSIAYGLVPVWAYFGIWLKHTSTAGFGYAYPSVISMTLVSIALLVLANAYLVLRKQYL